MGDEEGVVCRLKRVEAVEECEADFWKSGVSGTGAK